MFQESAKNNKNNLLKLRVIVLIKLKQSELTIAYLELFVRRREKLEPKKKRKLKKIFKIKWIKVLFRRKTRGKMTKIMMSYYHRGLEQVRRFRS